MNRRGLLSLLSFGAAISAVPAAALAAAKARTHVVQHITYHGKLSRESIARFEAMIAAKFKKNARVAALHEGLKFSVVSKGV